MRDARRTAFPAWAVAVAFMLLIAVTPAPARELPGHVEILPASGSVQVAFAPWDDVETLLVNTLATARAAVLVQAYLLTSRTFAFSLIEAKQRGVEVQVLADGRQHADNPGSLLALLHRHGIPVWLETRYRNAHNKVVVIDADGGRGSRPVVISGSYNFTWSAQHMNAENLLIIRDHPALALRYANNWRRHQQQAIPLSTPPMLPDAP